jgi:uncharacterized membrane protein YhaH (DUF805 family)
LSEKLKAVRGFFDALPWVLFSLKGRLNRKGFWVGFALSMLPYLYFDALVHKQARDPLETIALVFLIVFVIWANIGLVVKRLHDFSWTGWAIVPFTALYVAAKSFLPGAELGFIIFLGLLPGTPFGNKYGHGSTSEH